MDRGRAVVIVSGGDAISPFTTPEAGCAEGLAAGSTDTALRGALLEAGHRVFTSPANAGEGQATADLGFGGFAAPPEVLSAELTVNSVGPIADAGVRLARFLEFVCHAHSATSIDLVGHSMGGLFSRAAIAELAAAGSSVTVRSLTTIGTPWQGAFPADYANGDLSLAAAHGHPSTAAIMVEFKKEVDREAPGASAQVTHRHLMEPGGENEQRAGVIDGIPLTLIGGDHFRSAHGTSAVWPHDGLVTLSSALASDIAVDLLRSATKLVFHDVHSLYFSHLFHLPQHRALTWDPDVHAAVIAAISG